MPYYKIGTEWVRGYPYMTWPIDPKTDERIDPRYMTSGEFRKAIRRHRRKGSGKVYEFIVADSPFLETMMSREVKEA